MSFYSFVQLRVCVCAEAMCVINGRPGEENGCGQTQANNECVQNNIVKQQSHSQRRDLWCSLKYCECSTVGLGQFVLERCVKCSFQLYRLNVCCHYQGICLFCIGFSERYQCHRLGCVTKTMNLFTHIGMIWLGLPRSLFHWTFEYTSRPACYQCGKIENGNL